MNYILLLDHYHLDEPVFLKSLAQTLGTVKNKRGILLHADSSYTERIVQTGVLTEDAKLRSMKDLNNRLIALLADHGVSAVGLNGYQRDIIRKTGPDWQIKADYIRSFPDGVSLVLSCLVANEDDTDNPMPATLSEVGTALARNLNIDMLIAFTSRDAAEVFASNESPLPFSTDDSAIESSIVKEHLPEELHSIEHKVTVTSTQQLGDLLNECL